MRSSKRYRVGIFDSGIGGLTVLYECIRRAPQVKYYYFGDNARAPYGSRSPEEIAAFVREALIRFQKMRVDAVVLACNTATAVAARRMREEFAFPIIGMEPAVKPAGKVCRKVLVLATPRTAESVRLKSLTESFPDCVFKIFPAADLAAAIERFYSSGREFELGAHLPRGSFDGVVLGCTHYVFCRDEIARFYKAPVFDGNEGTAKRLFSLLNLSDIGTDDHLISRRILIKTLKKQTKFVGSNKNINKNVFFRTFVSKKNEK